MKNLIGLASCLAVVGCDASDKADDLGTCFSIARVPGITDVTTAPRANVVAEALAVRCGGGVAAPEALYEELAADLDLIFATDARMAVLRGGGGNVAAFAREPLVLMASGSAVAAARATIEEGTCAHELTATLHGTAVETSTSGSSQLIVEFAPRLDPSRVVEAYADLGVALEINFASGGGSSAQYREVEGGREYSFGLGAWDCSAGCIARRYFVWRVVAGRAELVAEYGDELDVPGRGTYTPPPEGLDVDFSCD